MVVASTIVSACSSVPECEPVNSKTERQIISSIPSDSFENSGLQLANFSAIRSKEIDGTWFVASEWIFDHSERSSHEGYDKYLRQQRIGVWAITDFGDGKVYTANIYAASLSRWNWNELRWRDHSEEIDAAENCVREQIYEGD